MKPTDPNTAGITNAAPIKRSTPVYVDTHKGLAETVSLLIRKRRLGIDLEADSMYHFKEKVCLIQIATPDRIFIIDPLSVKDLTPLSRVFTEKRIQKIFHGADYDIRSLYRDYKISIKNLFDTELACRFLGMTQTGLEKVTQKYFGQTLNKKYQKKDWSQRPLPSQMIEYAAKDTCYLMPLAAIVKKKLKEKNRLAWVAEECELLSRVRPSPASCDPIFLNFKGAGKLKRRSLSVLEDLLHYRKQVAEQTDKPLFKIIGNRSLLTLAIRMPSSFQALQKSQTLSAVQLKRYGSAVLNIIQAGLKRPENELPEYPKRTPPRTQYAVALRIKMLKTWREETAAALGIDPALVLNKSQMLAIATQNPVHLKSLKKIEWLRRWQIREFGTDILNVLHAESR
jgi:ribonuclease D